MGSLDQPAETSLPPQIQVIKDRFDDDDTADGDSRTEKCFDFGESRSRFRVYCMNFCAPLTPQFDFSVPSVTATPASRPFELNYRQKVIEGRKRSLRFLTETHNNALAVRKTISKALKVSILVGGGRGVLCILFHPLVLTFFFEVWKKKTSRFPRSEWDRFYPDPKFSRGLNQIAHFRARI
mmetsp:Transcript_21225/g.48201  ORF Transcript_21225/g.48201 Transcript_21225/m.48201 type:complete len:181 (+) Transcript_21225:277-819(+)